MSAPTLEIKAALQVARTPHEVYEAVVDPAIMSNYFISWGSARMDADTTIEWSFPEMEGRFPVTVGSIKPDAYVSFNWDIGDKKTLVEINLSPYGDGHTVVTVTEKSMNNDEAGIQWLKGNTEGWANFLACMKAWLEYGIHLRKGAFDFRFP